MAYMIYLFDESVNGWALIPSFFIGLLLGYVYKCD